MDRKLRNIQRRIAAGDLEAISELDMELLRSGYGLVGITDPYGNRPGEAVFLAPLSNGLWAIVVRDNKGILQYYMEEEDTPGEHIGEYTSQDAKKIANQLLEETKATWATDDIVCPDPRCASRGRTIIESSRPFGTSVAWEAPEVELHLRCVECGHKWVDYGGGLFRRRRNPDEKIRHLLRNECSTKEQCFRTLERAGLDLWGIQSKLEAANKISADPGNFEQLAYKMGSMSLDGARRRVADRLLANYNFSGVVSDVGGWVSSTYSNYWECTVYVEPDHANDDATLARVFSIEFQPRTAIPNSWGAD